MADLDALVERCESAGAFGSNVVRDASNRSERDWPWWSVQIEQTDVVGSEKQRKTAEISLNSPAPGVPSVFTGKWLARIWHGESTDSFTKRGSRSFPWEMPSAAEFEQAVAELLGEAEDVLTGCR